MNINLLPRKGFIERRFFVLMVTVFVLLFALAYGLFTLYLHHQSNNLALQLELQGKRLEKAKLLNNLGWNNEVGLYEEHILQIKRYQLLADGLQTMEVDWSSILDHIQSLLPRATALTEWMTEGNAIRGKAEFHDITAATNFTEKMRQYEPFQGSFIDSIDASDGTGNVVYTVSFSAYLQLLSY